MPEKENDKSYRISPTFALIETIHFIVTVTVNVTVISTEIICECTQLLEVLVHVDAVPQSQVNRCEWPTFEQTSPNDNRWRNVKMENTKWQKRKRKITLKRKQTQRTKKLQKQFSIAKMGTNEMEAKCVLTRQEKLWKQIVCGKECESHAKWNQVDGLNQMVWNVKEKAIAWRLLVGIMSGSGENCMIFKTGLISF